MAMKKMIPTTGTEIAIIEQAKYLSKMNWRMAKALVEGKIDSRLLRFAEEVYETQKDIYEESTL